MAEAPKDLNYPRIVFHPETGANITVKSEAEVPIGWLARHPNDPAHEDGVIFAVPSHEGQLVEDIDAGPVDDPREREKRETPTDRTAIIAALKHRGVKFSFRTGTQELYTKLVEYEDNERRVQAQGA